MLSKFKQLGWAAALGLCCTLNTNARQTPPATPAQSVVVKGLKDASSWFRAESAHFVVYSDTSNDDVMRLLNNLEKLDYLLRVYTRDYRIDRPGEQKITLYYHDRVKGFDDIAVNPPGDAIGLYNSCSAGVQAHAVQLERLADSTKDKLAREQLNHTLSYIFEAYARHFLYRYTDIRSPSSYIDGFAQYFSSVRFADNRVVIGRVPASVGSYLYHIDHGIGFKLAYSDVFEPDDVRLNDDAQSTQRLEYLAKSWLMTHYMFSSPANLASTDKYLNLVHQDVPAPKAFEDVFGIKAGDMDKAMWRYRTKGVEVIQADVPDLPAARVNFIALPAAATAFVLADATLRSCPSRKDGEAVLRALAAHPGGVPNNDAARLTMSRAQISWGNPADALPYLSAASAGAAPAFEALYLLGVANLRLAAQATDAARDAHLQAAKQHIARARQLQPRSAEAAYAAFQIELATSDKPVLTGAISAWHNAHEVNTYARSAALALAHAGRAPEADNALTLLAHNGRDPDLAKWAKTWQSRLQTGVSRADLLAELRREREPSAPFREWTLASEYLLKKAQFNASVDASRAFLETLRISEPAENKALFGMPRKQQ